MPIGKENKMITNEELAYKLQLMSERIDKLQTQVDNFEVKDYTNFINAVNEGVETTLKIRKQVDDYQKQMLTPEPHEYKLKDDVIVNSGGHQEIGIYLYRHDDGSGNHSIYIPKLHVTGLFKDKDIRPLKETK